MLAFRMSSGFAHGCLSLLSEIIFLTIFLHLGTVWRSCRWCNALTSKLVAARISYKRNLKKYNSKQWMF